VTAPRNDFSLAPSGSRCLLTALFDRAKAWIVTQETPLGELDAYPNPRVRG
jgi:hypothetical protein